MRIRQLGDLPDMIATRVRNTHTATITKGTPVAYQEGQFANAGVIPVSALFSTNFGLLAGIATDDIPVNGVGDAVAFGYTPSARLVLATRAASTDAWPSYPAHAYGDALTINSSVNGLQRNAAGATGTNFGQFYLGSSLASATTQASSVGVAGALTLGGLYPVMVRNM